MARVAGPSSPSPWPVVPSSRMQRSRRSCRSPPSIAAGSGIERLGGCRKEEGDLSLSHELPTASEATVGQREKGLADDILRPRVESVCCPPCNRPSPPGVLAVRAVRRTSLLAAAPASFEVPEFGLCKRLIDPRPAAPGWLRRCCARGRRQVVVCGKFLIASSSS